MNIHANKEHANKEVKNYENVKEEAINDNSLYLASTINDINLSSSRSNIRLLGYIYIFFGIVSIVLPTLMGVAIELLLGVIFLVKGVTKFIEIFSYRRNKNIIMNLFLGLAYITVGLYLFFNPAKSLIILTIFVGLFLIAEGIYEIIMLGILSKYVSRLWLIISSITSLALGVLVIFTLPTSIYWALGLIVGFNLLTTGVTAITISNSSYLR